MRRLLALPLLAIALTGCPSYDSYTPVVSQKGLIPPDQFARYGVEQAQAVAVAREFGFAYQGDTPGGLRGAGGGRRRLRPDHARRRERDRGQPWAPPDPAVQERMADRGGSDRRWPARQ